MLRKFRELIPILAAVVVLVILERTSLRPLSPGAVLYATVAYMTIRSGMAVGLIGAAVSLGYVCWFYAAPDGLAHREWMQIGLSGLSLLALAVLIGQLKDRADAASKRAGALAVEAERRQGFELLRESEMRLRSVVDTAIDGIITIDQQGVIQSVNAAGIAMFGYEPDQLIGQNVSLLMPDPHRGEHNSYLQKHDGSDQPKVVGRELVGRRKDGSAFPIELSVSPTHVGGRRMFTGIVRDVTERARAEKALRESHARLKAIVDGSADAVFMKDLDGRYLLINAAAAANVGKPIEQIVGRTDADLVAPEIAAEVRAIDRQVIASRIPQTYEMTMMGHLGKRSYQVNKDVFCDADGNVLGIFGVSRDVTERKQIEQERERLMDKALAERARLEEILEQMPAGVAIAEAPTGRLLMANRQLARIWHVETIAPTSIEAYRQFVGYRPDGSQYQPNEWPLARTVQRGEVITAEEIRIVRDDGTEAWIHINAGPIRDPEGAVVAAVATVLDVTGSKSAEDAHRRQEAELAHLARVTSMGQLTAGLAHELNQPLGAILNYAGVCVDLAVAGEPTSPAVVDALREIVKESKRSGEIIRRLRGFVRKQMPQAAPAELNHIVREALAILSADLRVAGVQVRLDLAEPSPIVTVDSVQIEQVLINLLRNAIDAMAEQDVSRRQVVLRTTSDDHGRGCVGVCDSGCGLNESLKNHLFQAFYTTKPNGLGLGLSISRSIVESHGGSMSVESNSDRGVTFSFTLPLQSGEAVHEPRLDCVRD